MTRSVALIGFGAIARTACETAHGEALPLRQVLVREGKSPAVQALLPEGMVAIENLDALLPDTALVIECAGHQALHQHGALVLARGIDLAVLSAGALADNDLFGRLKSCALANAAQLRVLSGAIGGIDALAAAGHHLSHVRYTGRKSPLSWQGSPAEDVVDLGRVTQATPVFQGSAREAALAFPKNANVVATVALAGAGFDNTEVTLIADPKAAGNTHEIDATGGGYDLSYKTVGAVLPSNPKTSALTAQSVLRALRHEGPGLLI